MLTLRDSGGEWRDADNPESARQMDRRELLRTFRPSDRHYTPTDQLTDEEILAQFKEERRRLGEDGDDTPAEEGQSAEDVEDIEAGDGPEAAEDEVRSRGFDLDRRLGVESDAPTGRAALERFAGPDGLTERQKQADADYVAAYGTERPWLRIAENADPLVRHVYCERDRAGGHDPARHDGWRDAESQEQRAAAGKDPAHPSDSIAYHNAVDRFKGEPPPDGIGGVRKQHTLGEHSTWIADPNAWAVATVRAIDHPDVQRALSAEVPPRNVKVSLEDVLGPEGYRACDGYSLDTAGFNSPREAVFNRDRWVDETRKVVREEGVDQGDAEAVVEQKAANGEIEWVKPRVERVESFEGGTCQVNFRPGEDGTAIATICYNPPRDATKGMP